MAFRFFRRVRIAPGVTLNFSKSGVSASVGPRGMKATLGPRGLRTTVGMPGTGLYYTELHTGKDGARRGRGRAPAPPPPARRAEELLELGFFQRLVTPKDEQALVNGCRELVLGNETAALQHLRQAVHLADGAYLAGFLALKLGRIEEALRHLTKALTRSAQLGKYPRKYGVEITATLAIAEHVQATLLPSRQGVLLGLVECHQLRKDWHRAIACLKELRAAAPDDALVLLSLCELVDEAYGGDRDAARRVVDWTREVENESAVHAAVLYYKARALRRLNLLHAARDTLTAALRRKKDRPPGFLNALYQERGEVYEALGRKAQARQDFQRTYAAAD